MSSDDHRHLHLAPHITVRAVATALSGSSTEVVRRVWYRFVRRSVWNDLPVDVLALIFSMSLRQTVHLRCINVSRFWRRVAYLQSMRFRQPISITLSSAIHNISSIRIAPTNALDATTPTVTSHVDRLRDLLSTSRLEHSDGSFDINIKRPGDDIQSVFAGVGSWCGAVVTTIKVDKSMIVDGLFMAMDCFTSLHTLSVHLELWTANHAAIATVRLRAVILELHDGASLFETDQSVSIPGHPLCEILGIESDMQLICDEPSWSRLSMSKQWPLVCSLSFDSVHGWTNAGMLPPVGTRLTRIKIRHWRRGAMTCPEELVRLVESVESVHMLDSDCISLSSFPSLISAGTTVSRSVVRDGIGWSFRPPSGLRRFNLHVLAGGSQPGFARTILARGLNAARLCTGLQSLDVDVDTRDAVSMLKDSLRWIIKHYKALHNLRLHSFFEWRCIGWLDADRLTSHYNLRSLHLCFGLFVSDSIAFIHKFPRLESEVGCVWMGARPGYLGV